jgi:two-component system cell cycle sensor histidine kinase PleC
MAEITLEAGAKPPDTTAPRRRSVAQTMREARERLGARGGVKPAFDVELTRLYAQNRLSAAPAIVVLSFVVAGAATWWTRTEIAAVWLLLVLGCHAVVIALDRSFTRAPDAELHIRRWRRRLTIAEFTYAAAFATIITHLEPSSTQSGELFAIFVFLIAVAIPTVLSSSLPPVVWAGTLPVVLVVVALYGLRGDANGTAIAGMAAAAGVCFLVLADRLHRSTLMTIEFRAEKDALIAELEQAKANSDEARRRAEEANLAKSRFLATMSHELRTPLNAILGFSEVMQSEVFGPHSVPAYREYAGDIHESGGHLLNLINEILDLSRIEAGRYELNEDKVDLAGIAGDCVRILKLRAQTRGLVIEEVFEKSLPPIWADERAVRQICLNLLSNAIKFTPQGGELTVKVGWTASGGQYLSVKDTGPGIPDDEIPTVLASFGQGSLAIKTAEQGAGLGLPIVRGLIDLHGGTFTLRSRLRAGTEVVVTFPSTRVMSPLPPVLADGEAFKRAG